LLLFGWFVCHEINSENIDHFSDYFWVVVQTGSSQFDSMVIRKVLACPVQNVLQLQRCCRKSQGITACMGNPAVGKPW